MLKGLLRKLAVVTSFVLIFQFVACGTILYPERKGQISGRIDAGVAVLDGLGLLFFIIPGVIAFAVDFSTGAIYLPGTGKRALDMEHMRKVTFDPEQGSLANIERIIKKETGYDVKLDQNTVEISELKSTDDMMVRFAEVLPRLKDAPTALSMR